jgi:hypothetical protein
VARVVASTLGVAVRVVVFAQRITLERATEAVALVVVGALRILAPCAVAHVVALAVRIRAGVGVALPAARVAAAGLVAFPAGAFAGIRPAAVTRIAGATITGIAVAALAGITPSTIAGVGIATGAGIVVRTVWIALPILRAVWIADVTGLTVTVVHAERVAIEVDRDAIPGPRTVVAVGVTNPKDWEAIAVAVPHIAVATHVRIRNRVKPTLARAVVVLGAGRVTHIRTWAWAEVGNQNEHVIDVGVPIAVNVAAIGRSIEPQQVEQVVDIN